MSHKHHSSTSTSYDRAASDPVDTSRLFQPTSAEHPDDLFTPVRATPPQTIEPLPDIFPQLLHPPTPVNGSQPTIGPSPTSSTQTIEGTDSVTARIADVRHQLLQWNAQWGPIRHWPRLFEDAFGDAKEQGRSGPWVEEIQSVVEDGRKLVRQLEQVIDGSLPADSWMIRDSWRSSLSLMAHLLEGITVLETRLEIVAPFPHEAIWRHAHNHRETT